MMFLHGCPAPAKLNLFLHVIGRRDDGYHLLESVFQLIDLADTLDFDLLQDGAIRLDTPHSGVAPEDDLTIRAARLLQSVIGTTPGTAPGVAIRIVKRIPVGGGLGGGSSDAATTLLALNRLWRLDLPRERLMELGLRLGADVPFFLFGRNALAQGIGERLRQIATPTRCFGVIYPGISVPTATVFGAPELTRNTEAIKMADFSAGTKPLNFQDLGTYFGNSVGNSIVNGVGHNDLEPVAVSRFPGIGAALDRLNRFPDAAGPARMSGSGSCVFRPFATRQAAEKALQGLTTGWNGWVCETLDRHPMFACAVD